MPRTTLCRLCITTSNEFKSLFDDNDEPNDVYNTAIKYFDQEYLQAEKYRSSVICVECWEHISEFNAYQQSIINNHQLQLKYAKSVMVVKLDDTLRKKQENPPKTTNKLKKDTFSNVSVFDIIQINGETLKTTHNNTGLSNLKITAVSGAVKDIGPSNTTINSIPSTSFKKIESNDTESLFDILQMHPTAKKHSMDAFITSKVKNLECSICRVTFLDYPSLSTHFADQHPDQECHIFCCGRKFNKRFKIVRHIRRVHDGKERYRYKCEICARPFFEACKLKNHLRQVHNRLQNFEYKCELCDESFEQEVSLKIHVNRKHKDPIPMIHFNCPECNRLFKCLTTLNAHRHKDHGITGWITSLPKFLCNICKVMVITPKDYLNHMEEVHNAPLSKEFMSALQSSYNKNYEEQIAKDGDAIPCSSSSFVSNKIPQSTPYKSAVNNIHPQMVMPPKPPVEMFEITYLSDHDTEMNLSEFIMTHQ